MLNKIEKEGNIRGVWVKAGLVTHCATPGWYVVDGDLMLSGDGEPLFLAPVSATEDEAADVFARLCEGESVNVQPHTDFTIALLTNNDEPGWYVWAEGAVGEGPWLLGPECWSEAKAKAIYANRIH